MSPETRQATERNERIAGHAWVHRVLDRAQGLGVPVGELIYRPQSPTGRRGAVSLEGRWMHYLVFIELLPLQRQVWVIVHDPRDVDDEGWHFSARFDPGVE